MASSHFSTASPPMFDGNNYPVWAIKMRSYLQAYDLWELVEVDYEMLEHETVKEFSNKLMKIVNQIRLHGEFLPDQRIVEKILICFPEKYEAKISTLEETRDLTQLTVAELINALQATEQRRSLQL
ncbi:uncharacterized protein LOC132800216 [Ziziphus jujuba]|uniref:Uncharacterized protein LOC132800216 n=1 Tax=Ziziphus jujuba TaxID=326968 RepID=A0ABM3ZY23_ZIZJJ|nr:uncharacterized protein LOC132800216 [Ziziphus jujuba]